MQLNTITIELSYCIVGKIEHNMANDLRASWKIKMIYFQRKLKTQFLKTDNLSDRRNEVNLSLPPNPWCGLWLGLRSLLFGFFYLSRGFGGLCCLLDCLCSLLLFLGCSHSLFSLSLSYLEANEVGFGMSFIKLRIEIKEVWIDIR